MQSIQAVTKRILPSTRNIFAVRYGLDNLFYSTLVYEQICRKTLRTFW